jgi:uncharacterized membrane protein
MRKVLVAALAIIIASFAIGVYLYPQMPESMPTHWNERGEVNGYMPKFWGLFLMPLISAGILALFAVLPRLDPLKNNVKKFMGYYEGFIILFMMFMLYVYMLTISWVLGFTFNMIQFLIPALGILFVYTGFLLEKAKRNWFIGIRTPWTLSSDKVWDKTHRLGGKLFKLVGLVTFLGVALPDYAFWMFFLPVIAVSFFLVAYSYFEFRKEKK